MKSSIAAAVVVLSALLAVPALASRSHQTVMVAVTATEFHFKFTPASVMHGSVTFHVVNKGKLSHDFKIAGQKTPLIKPGKSANLTVTLKAGKVPYTCTVPGHAAAGMKGTLVVK